MTQEEFIPNAAGSQADLKSKVEIGKVHGGYFSNLENARQFCDVGIAPIEKELPHYVKYADFGGGDGFLAKNVAEYLALHGHETEALVTDNNENYLEIAKNSGLETILCGIEDCVLPNRNLVTMRSVLQYNSLKKTTGILKNTFNNLAGGGFLVNQLASSTTTEGCELRSRIFNLPSLGRVISGQEEQYYFMPPDEYTDLLNKTGFNKVTLGGHAPQISLTLEAIWGRTFGSREKESREKGDTADLGELEECREKFYQEAGALIKEYACLDTKDNIGVEQLSGGNSIIHYQYPIFISQK